MASVYGNTAGLKKSQLSSLEKIYRRKVQPDKLITPELARYLTSLSFDLGRQIGVILSRRGSVTHVILGDANSVFIPALEDYPMGRKALRGLRFIHTHLTDAPLNNEDLTDLALLRFDMIAAISVSEGLPLNIYTASLMPQGSAKKYDITVSDFHRLDLDFAAFVNSLEAEMDRHRVLESKGKKESAILVSASTKSKYDLEDSMDELEELSVSSDIAVLDTVIQRLKEINPKHLLGEGKLSELIISAMDKGATMLVFDQDLSPSQIRSIADKTELKVIDRSQLILDIFAGRAHSRDGKVQVELAQLKYMLPRLSGKGTAMSRLMGGIGGRGPGEMKLEIDRRRIRDRITRLENELKGLSEARRQRKQRRVHNRIPIVSIIGYTNAGKSTLLNALTKSATIVEDKMFATLDTASRRLRFPKEREIIITDTVGFIRDLPKDLLAAFKATLEELEDADLLIHLADASNPRMEQQIASVESILDDLKLSDKKKIMALNKSDLVSTELIENLKERYNAVAVSALNSSSFDSLLQAIELSLWE
ncbi:MAG: GTPase HflX [Nitrospirae bacterium]|nr:MAG: GTPase HflX [Nitrospirota bacterium]